MKPQFTIWLLPVLPGWEDSKGPRIKNHLFQGTRVTLQINNSLNSLTIDISDYVFKINLKQFLEFYFILLFFFAVLGLHCCAAFFWLLWRGTTLQLWCKGSAIEHGLQGVWFTSCGSQHRLISCGARVCATACEIFPDQGLNPRPLPWQADSPLLSHQWSPE